MPDDKSQSGGQDRKRISLSQEYEVRDWAKKFNVTPEQTRSRCPRRGQRCCRCRGTPEGHPVSLCASRRGTSTTSTSV